MNDLRYPIGKFDWDQEITRPSLEAWMRDIEQLPARIRQEVQGLDQERLDAPYRPDGWTVRQVVHHLADSHMNAFVRFKLAMTEDEPTIKPYLEDRWARLEDARVAPAELSLALIEGLHGRWILLLRSMSEADFSRTLRHPERGILTLGLMLGLYGFHGRHHTAHISALRARIGW
jgi:hypothetical protein